MAKRAGGLRVSQAVTGITQAVSVWPPDSEGREGQGRGRRTSEPVTETQKIKPDGGLDRRKSSNNRENDSILDTV